MCSTTKLSVNVSDPGEEAGGRQPRERPLIVRQVSAVADVLGGASVNSPVVGAAPTAWPSALTEGGQFGPDALRSAALSALPTVTTAATVPLPPPLSNGAIGASNSGASESPDVGPISPSKRSRGGRRFLDTDDSPQVDAPAAADDSDGDESDRPSSPPKRRSFAREPASALPPPPVEESVVHVVDLFSPGMLRVPVFRIPSLLPLPVGSRGDGVVLAFAEARPALHDSGVIDLVMRRSTDRGVTWGAARVVVEGGMMGSANGATVGNPTAVYDSKTETVWLLLCSNHADDAEWMIHAREGKESRRVWITSSTDFGVTWAAPKEITSSVKRRNWTWYAVGPGAGIQLANGRLLIPANHAEDVHEPHCPYLAHARRSRMVAHCIYSDDHGKSWHIGGCATNHTNETQLAQLANGDVVLNSRDWSGAFLRVIQISTDNGNTWQAPRYDRTLIEPRPQGCQGSLLALPPASPAEPPVSRRGRWPQRNSPTASSTVADGTLLFCNPSSGAREMLTVRRSDNGGKTWTSMFLLEEGPSAYSCMGILSQGTIGVLYERADRISFATLPLDTLS